MNLHLLGASAIGLLLISPATVATTRAQDAIDQFSAFAVATNPPGTLASSPVDIIITRWSTDEERDKMTNLLMEQGSSKLGELLDEMPRAAIVRPAGRLGIEFHFAVHRTLEDGTERIGLLTNRPVSFWPQTRSPDPQEYPFTLVELVLKPDGKGEGKLSLATRIIADKEHKTIQLEDYVNQPMLLQNVRRTK
jgi:hypothetical protein